MFDSLVCSNYVRRQIVVFSVSNFLNDHLDKFKHSCKWTLIAFILIRFLQFIHSLWNILTVVVTINILVPLQLCAETHQLEERSVLLPPVVLAESEEERKLSRETKKQIKLYFAQLPNKIYCKFGFVLCLFVNMKFCIPVSVFHTKSIKEFSFINWVDSTTQCKLRNFGLCMAYIQRYGAMLLVRTW